MPARFLGRPVSPQIVAAVEEGWLPRGGHVLDAGCGEGDVAAWMAEQGFSAVGIDIAPSAVARARARHPETEVLRFAAADLRRESVSERPFDVVIDRGCLHQMYPEDLVSYGVNLTSMSAPDARMIVFHRAYRDGISQGDPAERRRVVERVDRAYAGRFTLERIEDAWIDPKFGADPATRLGGVVLWLRRTSP